MSAPPTSAASPAAAAHFALYRHTVVSRMLRRLTRGGFLPGPTAMPAQQRAAAEGADPFAFLLDEQEAMRSGQQDGLDHDAAPAWWDEQLRAFEVATRDHLSLRSQPGGHTDARLVVAAGLIEDDIRYGSVFAALQAPLPSRRPCIGLLTWLLADSNDDLARLSARCQALVAEGLLLVDNATDPRSEWVIRVPISIWDLVRLGETTPGSLPPSLTYRPPGSFPVLEQVVVPSNAAEAVRRLPAMLAARNLSALVVRGMDGSGRLTLLGSLAAATGRGVVVHDGEVNDEGWRLLGPVAAFANALGVVVARPAPGETLKLPALAGASETVGVVLGRAGGIDGPMVESAYSVTLDTSGPDERRTMWQAAGLPAEPAVLDEIAERFLLTPGNVHRAATLAASVAALDGRDSVEPRDVQTANRALNRQVLETLATPLPPLDASVRPILTPAASEELASLLIRCRQRERLTNSVGPALRGNLNRGVRALLSGPSGSGKTLTARYVAAALGMDLYRVDLASVVNKYIGETERNLDLVLSRAEELDVVLLLDEGDALMAPRTEVSNANDRYANLETNYLLQRLETYEGIALVTTNASSRIDPAFQRRIDVVVDLVPPDPSQRLMIWQAHLPADHQVTPALLSEVARRCSLTGGRIRNTALHATLLALDRGTPITDADVEAAVRREYHRSGASYPMAPS